MGSVSSVPSKTIIKTELPHGQMETTAENSQLEQKSINTKMDSSNDSEDDNPSGLKDDQLAEGELEDIALPKKTEKWTEEKILEGKEKVITRVEKSIAVILEKPIREKDQLHFTQEFLDGLLPLYKSYYSLKGAPSAEIKALRLEIAKKIVSSNVLSVLCQMIIDLLKNGYRDEEGKSIKDLYNPFKNVLLLVVNFSDCSPPFTHGLCTYPAFLETFAEKLPDMLLSQQEGTLKQNDENIQKWLMGIIHNCSMHELEDNIHRLRSINFIPVLVQYLDCSVEISRLSALATLAEIVDEKESEILQTNVAVIQFLMKTFKGALKAKNKRCWGWSSREIARTVGYIARNDANKKLLVEQGALPLLVKLAKIGTESDELTEAVTAIWALSFDVDNQQVMVDDEELGVVDTLVTLQSSPYPQVKKMADGALWTMREKLKESQKYKELGNAICGIKKTHEADSRHIMISYQWANQKTIVQIMEELRRHGYKVWLDIEQMGGSTLQAMADAVEQASVVLVCMSQKYKDSPNCRAEAEYAFQKRKEVVPLVLESGYKADGWLGFIIGAKLYFDFSGKYSFESKMEGLLTELTRIVKVDNMDAPIKPQSVLPTMSAPKETHKDPVVRRSNLGRSRADHVTDKWTSDQVQMWLKKHNLSSKRLSQLSGIEIDFLSNLRYEAPEFFYQTLEKRLGITDLLTLALLTRALEDLTL